jgi:hypothetical protein
MRTILIIAMLLLMPIRGFIGDAMAYEMLASDLKSVSLLEVTTPKSDIKQAAEHSPCHAESSASLDDEPGHSNCTACQACHYNAVIYADSSARLATANHAAPAQLLSFWHSAELVRLIKPPVL